MRSSRFGRPAFVAVLLGCSAESAPDGAYSASSAETQSVEASGYTFSVDGDLHGPNGLLSQPAHLAGAFDLEPHSQWEKPIRNLSYKLTLDKNSWFDAGELTSMDPSFTPNVLSPEWKDTSPGWIDFTWKDRDDVRIVIDSLTVVRPSDRGTVLGRDIDLYGSRDREAVLRLQGYCDRTMKKCQLDQAFSGVTDGPRDDLMFQFAPTSPLRLTPKSR